MTTLNQLSDGFELQLIDVGGCLIYTSWSEPPPAATGSKMCRVHIASTEEVFAGSNSSIRTAEVLVEVWKRASNIASMEAMETDINTALDQLIATAFWQAIPEVRNSPLPEVEVDTEVERIGEVLRFILRVRVALEA